jgi:hypothetical protein
MSIAIELLPLPPGSVPVEPVRSAIRGYRAGIGSSERLIAAVDRHGDALEREIARRTVENMADFQRTINRLELLAGYISMRLAQLEWLASFPAGADVDTVPLSCPIGDGREIEVAHVLAALRAVELPARAVQVDARPRRDGRRGAAPSMAALADARVSITDVALELGIDRRKAWAVLNGHQRSPPELQQALTRLLGADQAAIVVAGIPQHPRARAPASAALEALHAAGATAEDLAPLIPAQPGTVRRWLRGTLRPSAKHATALAGALEQLLGARRARSVLGLVPERSHVGG